MAHNGLPTNGNYSYRAIGCSEEPFNYLQCAHSFNNHQLPLCPKREPRLGGAPRTCREDCISELHDGPKMDTRDSPVERVVQQKGLCPPTLGITFPGTQRHSLPDSRFRCQQLFGPAREWPSQEQAMEAGRAWRRASRGGTKAALNLNPPVSLSLPRFHPTSPGPDQTVKGEEMPAISTSCYPCRPLRAASLCVRTPHLPRSRAFSLLPLGRGITRGQRRGGGGERCAARRAVQPLPLRGHISRRPAHPPRVGSSHRCRSSALRSGRQL